MQLRSDRRLVTPPMPAPRGGVPWARPQRCHADPEDRLSSLPDELRIEVLARLGCAREAARTSVLSSRWRGLWAELRDLTFKGEDRDSLDAMLGMVPPLLHRLRLRGRQETAARISSLRRAGDYSLRRGSFIEMPLFKRTTSIDLFIEGLNFRLPAAGNFEKLEHLILYGRGFVKNPSAFLHRCPRLRELEIDMGPSNWETKIPLVTIRPNDPRAVTPLAVESKSLEEVTWQSCCSKLVAVHTVAPNLKKFTLTSMGDTGVTVSLSAPKLEEFYQYGCRYSRIGSGEIWLLVQLRLEMMKGWSSKHGRRQRHLPRFRDERVLSLIVKANEVRRTPSLQTVASSRK
ncbi:hypothetical protein PVAP13_6NG332740 [Panicum virgatum]|uniref:F-box domain-containing protein n=1 Tax=Panicum virgatum TaxID=38727 RepID=A0A8T0R4Q9_PANVG|nr:hypothetical protein PVAP13_6NG332740 [Panicum virgatum]